MISFKLLGKYGRLGNQMFQFAFLYGAGKKNGYEIGFDYSNDPLIAKIFNLPAKNSDNITQSNILDERGNCGYIETKGINDGTDLKGYFQNNKYIDEIEPELRSIFIFNEDKTKKCYEFIKQLKEKVGKQIVSLHVRRTDYLTAADTHFVCDKNYYEQAIKNFGKDYYYILFTDDKKWCAEEFKHVPNIIMNNNTEIDLLLMSLCDHHIISNSSYSWWGSWLNENLNKKIIAPKRWYNKKAPINWHEIYRKDMVLI
jgi:hypothetical protein